MGFRNPFRVQVDENDVAYISDYSPDANAPQRSRGPSGIGRYEIVRKPSNYGWPTCYKRDLAYYKWNFHEFAPNTTTAGTPLNSPPELHTCDGPTQRNDSMWNLEGGPSVEPGLVDVPPVTNPDIWYSYRDNIATAPLGTPCLALLRADAGADRPGLDDRVPAAVPGALHRRRRPARRHEVQLRPRQPEPEEVPAVLRRLGDLRRVDAGHDARGQARRAEPRVQDQRLPRLRQPGEHRGRPFLFECDNPMDMQWGADGAFYLLTYGNGFNVISPDAGMYKWEYVKGKRPPKAVLTTDRTDGPSPLTVNFSSAGSLDEDPGDSIRYEWNFGDGSPISTEPNPTHTYTQRGRFTAVLTVFDSSGEKTSTSTIITAATRRRRSRSTRRSTAGCSPSATSSSTG